MVSVEAGEGRDVLCVCVCAVCEWRRVLRVYGAWRLMCVFRGHMRGGRRARSERCLWSRLAGVLRWLVRTSDSESSESWRELST